MALIALGHIVSLEIMDMNVLLILVLAAVDTFF